jgi:DNA-binding MarR family transcriptional regulator
LSHSTIDRLRHLLILDRPRRAARTWSGKKGAGVECESRHEQLDTEILAAVMDLVGRIMAAGESMAQRLGVPTFFIKALHMLERPMAMKDLGKRMHCDPSFVTTVADLLEKRGLASREPRPGDRRVRNLVLTSDGLNLKRQIEREMAARMPWSRSLSQDECEQLLMLIRKMLSAPDPPDAAGRDSLTGLMTAEPGSQADAGEVDDTLSADPAAVG